MLRLFENLGSEIKLLVAEVDYDLLLTIQTLQLKAPPLHQLSLRNPAPTILIQGMAIATTVVSNATCPALF